MGSCEGGNDGHEGSCESCVELFDEAGGCKAYEKGKITDDDIEGAGCGHCEDELRASCGDDGCEKCVEDFNDAGGCKAYEKGKITDDDIEEADCAHCEKELRGSCEKKKKKKKKDKKKKGKK